MKIVKEIRATFEQPADQENLKKLMALAVITGSPVENVLASAIGAHLGRPENAKHFEGQTWVSQTELVELLKTRFGIQTTAQTLMNWRAEGLLTGLFCSDGEKKIFYSLEKVAAKMGEPRTPKKPEKTVAA